MPNQLLRVDEVAQRLNLKVSTIRAWILKRRIPYIRLGRAIRISESVLLYLIEAGTVPAREAGGNRRLGLSVPEDIRLH